MKRPMTNIELINQLLGYSKHGPLMQVVVLEGLRAYCQEIVDAPPGFLGAAGNMISEDAWRGCCREYLDAYQNRDQLTVEEGEDVDPDDSIPAAVLAHPEKHALFKVLQGLASQGWSVGYVNDGMERIDASGKSFAEVIEDAAAVDQAWLWFRKSAEDGVGSIMLVWGNSPIELIADYTTSHGFEQAVDAALRSAWPNYPEE